jgi:hypothetical protein
LDTMIKKWKQVSEEILKYLQTSIGPVPSRTDTFAPPTMIKRRDLCQNLQIDTSYLDISSDEEEVDKTLQ